MTNVERVKLARESELMLRAQFNLGREITPEDEIQYRFSEIHYQMNLREAERMDAIEAEQAAKRAAKEAAEPYNVNIKSEVKIKSELFGCGCFNS